MKTTALITGASSGIGMALAKVFASKGHDLIIVARNSQALELLRAELTAQYAINVKVFQKDLSELNAAQALYADIKQSGLTVDYLINNAGFGDFGMFAETNWDKNQQMLALNIVALTQLTHLVLKDMSAKQQGRIMNVASTAAFQACPKMAVYAATKAYVMSFTEAINNEYKSFGVTATALCPGPTESGFMDAASMHNSAAFKGKKLPSSMDVAVYAYKAMMKGKSVAIHGAINAILANAGRFIPRDWVTAITRKVLDSSAN